MFVILFLLTGLVLWLGGTAALAYGTWRMWYEDKAMASMAAFGAVLIFCLGALLAGMLSGEIKSGPPDGCYRIGTTTSTGVGTVVGPKGQVGVGTIVTSGRSYTPIACP